MPSTDKTSRRDEILQALARMLENTPNARVTTAALAREVGVSEAALYRHFPSKARIFEALIAYVEDTLFSRLNRIAKEAPSTQQRCADTLLLILSFAEKNPGLSRLVSGAALTGEAERLHDRINQLFKRIESQLKQILREGEVTENCRTHLVSSSAAELLTSLAEGKIRRFVRSDFRHLPTTEWREQWAILNAVLFIDPGRN